MNNPDKNVLMAYERLHKDYEYLDELYTVLQTEHQAMRDRYAELEKAYHSVCEQYTQLQNACLSQQKKRKNAGLKEKMRELLHWDKSAQ